mgnify:CR=1 FL=1
MINRVTLLGRLGRDAEVRQTPKGSVIKFSMATENNWKDAQGAWQSDTTWHSVSAFGKDYLAPKLVKGATVYVEGKFKSYEVDGQRRWEVNALTVKVVEPKVSGEYTSPQELLPPLDPPRGGWG